MLELFMYYCVANSYLVMHLAVQIAGSKPALDLCDLILIIERLTSLASLTKSAHCCLHAGRWVKGGGALAKLIGVHCMWSSHTAAAALRQSEATCDPIYNKNLAMANRSRVSFAHNTSRASTINP